MQQFQSKRIKEIIEVKGIEWFIDNTKKVIKLNHTNKEVVQRYTELLKTLENYNEGSVKT